MTVLNSCLLLAYLMPTDVATMNYNSVILAGVVVLTTAWWLLHAVRHYPGPKVMTMYIHDDQTPLEGAAGPQGLDEKTGNKDAA